MQSQKVGEREKLPEFRATKPFGEVRSSILAEIWKPLFLQPPRLGLTSLTPENDWLALDL
jgi:hypothetical protein